MKQSVPPGVREKAEIVAKTRLVVLAGVLTALGTALFLYVEFFLKH